MLSGLSLLILILVGVLYFIGLPCIYIMKCLKANKNWKKKYRDNIEKMKIYDLK